jgi:hypothetical protein
VEVEVEAAMMRLGARGLGLIRNRRLVLCPLGVGAIRLPGPLILLPLLHRYLRGIGTSLRISAG